MPRRSRRAAPQPLRLYTQINGARPPDGGVTDSPCAGLGEHNATMRKYRLYLAVFRVGARKRPIHQDPDAETHVMAAAGTPA